MSMVPMSGSMPIRTTPAAGYFTIHGGSQAAVLRGIETEAAVRLEMHESTTTNGMMEMKPLDTVDVPAGSTVAFAPGGKHLMLWSINPQALAAGKISFKMIFSNGDRLLVDAVVEGPRRQTDRQRQPGAQHGHHAGRDRNALTSPLIETLTDADWHSEPQSAGLSRPTNIGSSRPGGLLPAQPPAISVRTVSCLRLRNALAAKSVAVTMAGAGRPNRFPAMNEAS